VRGEVNRMARAARVWRRGESMFMR
jgi:hypothetical protein